MQMKSETYNMNSNPNIYYGQNRQIIHEYQEKIKHRLPQFSISNESTLESYNSNIKKKRASYMDGTSIALSNQIMPHKKKMF